MGVDHGYAVVAVFGVAAADRARCTRERPRRLAHRDGIDQHEHVVALEQLVGEMDAADAEVGDAHPVGHGLAGKRLATSTPKPSSPRKMLPMPATSTGVHRPASARRSGSTSSGWKYR